MIGAVVTAIMLIMLMLRIPVAITLALSGFGGLVWLVGGLSGEFSLDRGLNAALSSLADVPFSASANFTLTTVPMFMLMGYVAYLAGFTRDIYLAARLWLTRLPGGLAVASTIGCAAFAAVSGSSLATAAAMGRISIPEMLKFNYDKGIASGTVAASGTLGSLIPPSVLMILYAVFTDQSIAKLFVAGIIPGLLSAAIYIVMIVIRCKLNPDLAPPIATPTWSERFRSLKGTWGIIALFMLVMGGIYGGWFTPTEAGSIGAMGAFVLAFISRRLNRPMFREALSDTMRQTSMLFAILIGAYLMISFTALSGIAEILTLWVQDLDVSPFWIVLSLSLVYIMLGTFMGALEIMLLTLPIVTPIIEGLGYDLIWFGIIMIKYLEIGLITPPVGLNVYVIKSVVGDRIALSRIFRGILWFLAMDFVTLLILVAFPQITLFLPGLM